VRRMWPSTRSPTLERLPWRTKTRKCTRAFTSWVITNMLIAVSEAVMCAQFPRLARRGMLVSAL
jgi:hypothetical protein